MAPVPRYPTPEWPGFLCPIGTRTRTADKLFIGWFGRPALAAIIFAVLVLNEKLPGNDTIILAAGWTVLPASSRTG